MFTILLCCFKTSETKNKKQVFIEKLINKQTKVYNDHICRMSSLF